MMSIAGAFDDPGFVNSELGYGICFPTNARTKRTVDYLRNVSKAIPPRKLGRAELLHAPASQPA